MGEVIDIFSGQKSSFEQPKAVPQVLDDLYLSSIEATVVADLRAEGGSMMPYDIAAARFFAHWIKKANS